MLIVGALVCFRVATAFAQYPETIDAETIVKALQPKNAPPTRPLVRSYTPLNRGIAIEGPEIGEEQAPNIDLVVNFEYDQSALTMSDAQITVDTLGRALNDPRLARSRFMIIGHTDARGGDGYNLGLSQRRANAVAARLRDFHAVAANRLVAEGRGMRELKDPVRPLGGINRRVQIKTITWDSSASADRLRPLPKP
ncbi:OmpA family protein [Rhodomicrobium vannielii]|nr:OmpA family protein [Rhodomicrobium vannielii]